MQTPSVTPAQLLAIAGAIVGLLVTFAVIDDRAGQAILAAASTLLPIALAFADAHVRGKRAEALAAGAVLVDGRMYAAGDVDAQARATARRHRHREPDAL